MSKTSLLWLLLIAGFPVLAEPSAPCSSPEHHQFDFWLGKWTAYDGEGKVVGTNHLHRIVDDCGLQENWVSARGDYKGTSYNFYIPGRRAWHQTWVDNQGGSLLLNGKFKNGQMQLQGQRKTAEGKKTLDRITWSILEDGRVRQHWQTSPDKGKTWSDVFDGYYQREDSDTP